MGLARQRGDRIAGRHGSLREAKDRFATILILCASGPGAAPAEDGSWRCWHAGSLCWRFPKRKRTRRKRCNCRAIFPSWVDGDPRRFTFHVTPLSGKGLLSRQVREALNALNHEAGGAPMRKIAYVAGSGDARRGPRPGERVLHRPPPAAPRADSDPGRRIAYWRAPRWFSRGPPRAGKKPVPTGWCCVSAQPSGSANPLDAVAPLAAKSLAALRPGSAGRRVRNLTT